MDIETCRIIARGSLCQSFRAIPGAQVCFSFPKIEQGEQPLWEESHYVFVFVFHFLNPRKAAVAAKTIVVVTKVNISFVIVSSSFIVAC